MNVPSINKVLVIGASSDLISPLTLHADESGLQVFSVTRSEWDLRDPHIPQSLLEDVLSFSPQHLVYAAGLNYLVDFPFDSDQLLTITSDHLNVNCLSFVSIVNTLAKHSKKPILTIHAISSLYGIYGRARRLPYSMSKHALEAAVKCLALEMPDSTVLAYRPGFFKTKLTDKNLSDSAQTSIVKRIPAGRFGVPTDLCNLIINNIVSPPIYASGSAITMDGGLTAGGIFDF